MNLNREIAKKALTDGFCLLYGEKYRNLFDFVGEEIIELGIKNGRNHYINQALHNADRVAIHIMVKHFSPNNKYKTVEQFKDTIRRELTPFLSHEDIEKLLVEQKYVSFSDSNFAMPIEEKSLFQKISNELEDIKPKPAKEIPSFDYFKQFPTYETHQETVNLATEGGFGLDQFEYEKVKYYLEEHEEFYLAEAIPYKYHQLGSTLIREELRVEFVDKIKKNITADCDYWVKGMLRFMIEGYCFSSEVNSSLLDIQTVCGEEGFSTPEQTRKTISTFKDKKK